MIELKEKVKRVESSLGFCNSKVQSRREAWHSQWYLPLPLPYSHQLSFLFKLRFQFQLNQLITSTIRSTKSTSKSLTQVFIQSNTPLHIFYFAFPFFDELLYAESVLEETNQKLTERDLYLEECEKRMNHMSDKIHHLHSTLSSIKLCLSRI